MTQERPTAQTISTSLSCPCHKNAATCKCKCHVAASICNGAIVINFPIVMFLPDGSLEYRMNRSDFLKGMVDIYNELAESARQELMRRDPQTIRPPLETLPIAVFELTDVHKSQVPWGELKDNNEEDGGH